METDLRPKYTPHKNLWGCIGKFYIPRSWFVKQDCEMSYLKFEQCQRLFKDMIVLECEFQFHSQQFYYTAISPLFSELPEERWHSNTTIPEYAVRLGNDGRIIFDTKG